MSARRRAWAMAPQPLISISWSAAAAGLVATLIGFPPCSNVALMFYCSIALKWTPVVRPLSLGPAPGSAVASPFVASWANSSSYRPRYWNPWDRNVTTLSSIFPLSQVLYVSFSFSYISNWLALSSEAASFTIVMQFSTGQTASQTPQPQQASMLAS